MHCGYAPFFDDNNFSTYEKILEAKIDWPKWINPVGKDLMKKLLVPDRFKRLGSMKVCPEFSNFIIFLKYQIYSLFHPEWCR